MNAETTVGAIVAERLGRARVFERLGIDYCCQGGLPLGEACARGSLDPGRVLDAIAASDVDDAADTEVDEVVDYNAMPPSVLAAHVVATHHAYLRRELPRLSFLIDKVLAAHGPRHPELVDLHATFDGLRSELESHLLKEERVLFPLVERLEAATAAFPVHCGTVENPIRVMRHEHDDAGAALARIRSLTDGYSAPPDACTTFKTLYDGLADLEADLHRHIHKENNILFPKAAALEAALAGAQ